MGGVPAFCLAPQLVPPFQFAQSIAVHIFWVYLATYNIKTNVPNGQLICILKYHVLKNVAVLTIFACDKVLFNECRRNIKRLREQKRISRQEIVNLIGMHRSNYSKIESSQRELSIAADAKVAGYIGVTIDELVHLRDELPEDVKVEDKTDLEQLKLIQELDPEEKNMVFKMIDTFLTKKKFKDFFKKNVATL